MKLLIVLHGSLGDVTRALPICALLKDHFENEVQIVWSVEPKCFDIVSMCKFVDDIIVFERNRGYRAIRKYLKDLWRCAPFDITLDLQRHLKSGVISLLSGARQRYGFHRRDSKEFNWIFNNRRIDYKGIRYNKLLHYLQFAKALGVKAPYVLNYGIEESAQESFSNIANVYSASLKRGEYLAIVLDTTWDTKQWPVEAYKQLCKKLVKMYQYRLVLIGSAGSVERASYVASNIDRTEQILNVAGKTSLRQLVGIIYGARAVIGPDSGPAHISSALGVPHVTLFGPTDKARVAPFGYESIAVESRVPCSPCWRKRCPGLNTICMSSITPSDVLEKLDIALSMPLNQKQVINEMLCA